MRSDYTSKNKNKTVLATGGRSASPCLSSNLRPQLITYYLQIFPPEWSRGRTKMFMSESTVQSAKFGRTPLEEAELAIRPVYKELNEEQKSKITVIKSHGVTLHARIGELPQSRETALAKTKLEEAIMWAVKAITK